MALPRIQQRGATGETARLMVSQFNVTTPAGMVVRQSPTGTEWRDDRLKPFPARISGDGEGSGAGSGPANNNGNYYDWFEVNVVAVNDEWEFPDKENGRFGTSDKRPAVEANGVQTVPIDSIVYLYPGPGDPDMYYFFWSGENGTGSGVDAEFTTYCEDGTRFKVTITDTEITVLEV